jgi:endonuclease I
MKITITFKWIGLAIPFFALILTGCAIPFPSTITSSTMPTTSLVESESVSSSIAVSSFSSSATDSSSSSLSSQTPSSSFTSSSSSVSSSSSLSSQTPSSSFTSSSSSVSSSSSLSSQNPSSSFTSSSSSVSSSSSISSQTTTSSITTSTTSQSTSSEPVYQGYYQAINGVSNAQLKSTLTSILRSILTSSGSLPSSITYGNARYDIPDFDGDPNKPNNVILVYSRNSVSSTWDDGSTWNREHVFPQSLMGVSTENSSRHKGADYHNLKPESPSVNSSRGNKYFAETTTTTSYAPATVVRGDVARILFYMVTMWPELSLVDVTATNSPATFQMAQLSFLVKWHLEDPVDSFEENRNNVI